MAFHCSCSLACTQSHKIYCAPPSDNKPTTTIATDPNNNGDEKNLPEEEEAKVEIEDLFRQYPHLRSLLQEIYQVTLEDAWQPFGGGGGGGHHRGRVNRGAWTSEKGFRRGLGIVRKLRERCEEEGGLELDKHAEGFVRFIEFVNRSTL